MKSQVADEGESDVGDEVYDEMVGLPHYLRRRGRILAVVRNLEQLS